MNTSSILIWMGRASQPVFFCAVLLAHLLSLAHAQITLDGSLGPGGPLTGPNFVIPADVGQSRGGNLFQSFGRFNILTGESATFTGPSSINNIVSRVTGGERSTIDGVLRSEIPGANLFLLNPAGVMFGPTGSLDVKGSFHVSTADYLKFADGAQFHANLTRESVLTSAPVSAFGFLSQNPAGISIQETILEVPEGGTFSVVGGDILVKGNINIVGAPVFSAIVAPTGKIQVASVASTGEVPANVAEMSLGDFQRVGEIVLSNSAFLDASGNTAGTVVIRSGKLILDSSSGMFANNHGDINATGRGIDVAVNGDIKLLNNSLVTTETFGTGHASDIEIVADAVEVDNAMMFSSTSASGNSGNVILTGRNFAIKGSIASMTLGSGKAGTVTVIADDTIKLDRMNSEIGSLSFIGTGDTGDVMVQAKNLAVTDGALIRSGAFEGGNAGDVKVMVTDGVSLDGINSTIASLSGLITPAGNSGNILVQAKNVNVTGGASIISAATGSGNGGGVVIKAGDTVAVDGVGSFISSSAATGAAGDILVEARKVRVIGGAGIASLTVGPENTPSGKGGTITVHANQSIFISGQDTGIASGSNDEPGAIFLSAPNVTIVNGGGVGSPSTEDLPLGRAGSTTIHSNNLILRGGKITTNTSTDSDGGNIAIHTGQLTLTDGATITSTSSSAGNAGDILVRSKEFHSVNSSVTTEADTADGGNVNLTVGNLVDLFNSQVSATVKSGSGSGGNITINSKSVTLNNSQITGNAFGGPGGNITVGTEVFLASPNSSITASSTLSTQGTVDIQAPVTDLSGTLTPLPENLWQATSLLQQSCAARFAGGKTSSLVVGQRDGLPLEPGGFMPSPLYRLDSHSHAAMNEHRVGPQEFSLASAKPVFSINSSCRKSQ